MANALPIQENISKDLDDIDINLLAGPTNTNLGGEDAIDINDMPQGTWGW